MKKLRQDAVDIFQAGLQAVGAGLAVERNIRIKDSVLEVASKTFDLARFKRIFVIGAGKASAAMAEPLEKSLSDRLTGGIIIVKHGHLIPLKRIKVVEAGHPVPDRAGVRASTEIISLLEKTEEDDLVFFLVSGGGSALLTSPAPGISLADIKAMTDVLLKSGVPIQEMNAIRKHLSRIKGGRLARMAWPSPLITLVLSDVIGNDPSSIASGPAAPDPTTFRDCLQILDSHGIRSRIPRAVLEILEQGQKGEIQETPKKGDPFFNRVLTRIVAHNVMALEACSQKAGALGYNNRILSAAISGETRESAHSHASTVLKIMKDDAPLKKPACLLSGGETTVTVRGKGLGGRNQEFVLAAAIELKGLRNIVILSAGTDGTDGPTDAAGAIADGNTVLRATDLGMEARAYLDNNDSYSFFKRLDDLIFTGPTNTNVMDLRVFLIS